MNAAESEWIVEPDAEHDPTSGQGSRRIPVLGARKFAAQLIKENEALTRELARLHEMVGRYGIEDAIQRTMALEDLAAEQAIQKARLRELITQVRITESRSRS